VFCGLGVLWRNFAFELLEGACEGVEAILVLDPSSFVELLLREAQAVKASMASARRAMSKSFEYILLRHEKGQNAAFGSLQ
jgi:hypothetical protein